MAMSCYYDLYSVGQYFWFFGSSVVATCCLPVAHHFARGLFEDVVSCPYLACVLGYVP